MWNAITVDDVLSEFNAAERQLLEEVQGAATELEGILGRTVAAARGSVLAGGGRLGNEGTIPDQVAPHVVAIARWRWLLSIPGSDSMQTANRKDLNDAGERYLRDIAKGDIKVEDPIDAAGESATRSPSFERKRLRFERCDEEGI